MRRVLNLVNKIISPLGIMIETTTLKKIEIEYYSELRNKNIYNRELYPVPKSFIDCEYKIILNELRIYEEQLNKLRNNYQNNGNFDINNIYYTSPDAEILYVVIQKYKPNKIIEIGSGNSTSLMHKAILDASLKTQLICIDPEPRIEINKFADNVYFSKAQEIDEKIYTSLEENDILFIDSSHKVETGSDLVFLLLQILPKLKKGVIIHIHDIFIPYEYPQKWVEAGWKWNEQYIVQAILYYSENFKVIWCGKYIQTKHPNEFEKYFPSSSDITAQSLIFSIA